MADLAKVNKLNIPTAAAPTKEFFVPATGTQAGVASDYIGDYAVVGLDETDDCAYITFYVPSDFSTIVNAEVLIIPRQTAGAANIDIYSDYALVGEAYNANSEMDEASAYGVTANQIFAIDISGILSALAANHVVGIQVKIKSTTYAIDVLGVRFKYS